MGMMEKLKSSELKELDGLESSTERKSRLISLYVVHLSMFLSGFGNALIYIGMFPYIQAVGGVSFSLASIELKALFYPRQYTLNIPSWSPM